MFYTIKRKRILDQLTGYLGTVEEDEEKITCYVMNDKIKKRIDHLDNSCTLYIGYNAYNLKNMHHIQKPVYYVFDKINFPYQNITIYGYDDSTIIFKNCHFKDNSHIHINVSEKCEFIDNTFDNVETFYLAGKYVRIKGLKKDPNCSAGLLSHAQLVGTLSLKMEDSHISFGDNVGTLSVSSYEGEISRSSISCTVGDFSFVRLQMDSSSSIKANNVLMIKLRESNKTPMNISTPILELDGVQFQTADLPRMASPYMQSVNSFLDTLRRIQAKCEESQAQQIENIKNQPIQSYVKK